MLAQAILKALATPSYPPPHHQALGVSFCSAELVYVSLCTVNN